MQQLILVGNLGRDPEMRYTPDGTPVTSFSLATNREWKSPDGTEHKETTWFRVSAWRRLAEVCKQYLSKGRQVLVIGELKPDPETGGPRIWTDNEGNPRTSFEVTARSVEFIGSRGDGGNGDSEGGAPDAGDEIPF